MSNAILNPPRRRCLTIDPPRHTPPPSFVDPSPFFCDTQGNPVAVETHVGRPSSAATIYRCGNTCWRVVQGKHEHHNYALLHDLCRKDPSLRKYLMIFDEIVATTPFILKGPYCPPAPLTWSHVREALVKLHSLGWSHNDVKPSNCLVKDGRTLLSDFGTLSRPGDDVVSTPLFLSPTANPSWRRLSALKKNKYFQTMYGDVIRKVGEEMWVYVKTFERDIYAYVRSRQEDWNGDMMKDMLFAVMSNDADMLRAMKGKEFDRHVYEVVRTYVGQADGAKKWNAQAE